VNFEFAQSAIFFYDFIQYSHLIMKPVKKIGHRKKGQPKRKHDDDHFMCLMSQCAISSFILFEVLKNHMDDDSVIDLQKFLQIQPDIIRKMMDALYEYNWALITEVFPNIHPTEYPLDEDGVSSILTSEETSGFGFQLFAQQSVFRYWEKYTPELYRELEEVKDPFEVLGTIEESEDKTFEELSDPMFYAIIDLNEAINAFNEWKENGGQPVSLTKFN